MKKVRVLTAEEAALLVNDGDTIATGGFVSCACPETLSKALDNGVITQGELATLQSGSFLRADLVYVSYYALDAVVAGSGSTLRETLLDKGIFTAGEARQAAAMVCRMERQA